MARRPKSVPVTTAGVERFPAIVARKLPEPRWAHAIDQPGVRRTIAIRAARAVRTLAIGVALFTAGLVPAVVWSDLDSAVAAPCLVAMLAGPIVAVVGVSRIISAAVMWRLLRRHPWQLYTCKSLTLLADSRRIRMYVTDHAGKTFWIRTGAGKRRRETLRGMTRPEIWLAGNPEKGAVVTPAGGPEIFYARRDMSARATARANARAIRQAARLADKRRKPHTPPTPRKPPKPLTPKQRAKVAADAARRTKTYTAARAKAAANRNASPPPPKPGLLRRGQKIKWMG